MRFSETVPCLSKRKRDQGRWYIIYPILFYLGLDISQDIPKKHPDPILALSRVIFQTPWHHAYWLDRSKVVYDVNKSGLVESADHLRHREEEPSRCTRTKILSSALNH